MQPNPSPNSLHLVSVFSPPHFVGASHAPGSVMPPIGSGSSDYRFVSVPPQLHEAHLAGCPPDVAAHSASAWTVSSSAAAAWGHVHATGMPLHVEMHTQQANATSLSSASSQPHMAMPHTVLVEGHPAHVIHVPPHPHHHLSHYIPIVAGAHSVVPVLHPGAGYPMMAQAYAHPSSGGPSGLLHHSLSLPSVQHPLPVVPLPSLMAVGGRAVGDEVLFGHRSPAAAVPPSPSQPAPGALPASVPATVPVPASRRTGASWIRDPQNVVRDSPSGPLHQLHHHPHHGGGNPLVSSIVSLAASQSLSQQRTRRQQHPPHHLQTCSSSSSAMHSGDQFVPVSSQRAESSFGAGSNSVTPGGGCRTSSSAASTPQSTGGREREPWRRSGAYSKDMYNDVLQRDDAFGEDDGDHRHRSSQNSSARGSARGGNGRGSNITTPLMPIAAAHSDPTHDGQSRSPAAFRRLTAARSNEEPSRRNVELFDRAVLADDFEQFVQRLASQNSGENDEVYEEE